MNAQIARAWDLLEVLTDPEIPVVTLRELGILRDVREGPEGLDVVITPGVEATTDTYVSFGNSGSPGLGLLACKMASGDTPKMRSV